MILAGAGQEEIENDWQDHEHRPKTWNFPTKKIRPNLGQYCTGHLREVLLFKPVLGNRLYKPCAEIKSINSPTKFMSHHRHHYHPWQITTREWCTWWRRNFEHCAQRRTLADFGVSNPPEIDFVSWFCWSWDFSKIMIFHENHEFSPPWCWPWPRSNFSPRIFWKLSASESQLIWYQLPIPSWTAQTTDRKPSTSWNLTKIMIFT